MKTYFLNLSIKKKILILVALSFLSTTSVLLVGLWQINKINKNLTWMIEGVDPLLKSARVITFNRTEERVHLRDILHYSIDIDKARLDIIKVEIDNFYRHQAVIVKEIKNIAAIINNKLSRHEKYVFEDLINNIDYALRSIDKEQADYIFYTEKVFNLIAQGKDIGPQFTIENLKKEEQKSEEGDMRDFLVSVEDLVGTSVDHANKEKKAAIVIMVLLTTFILLLSLITGIVISNSISKPLFVVAAVADKIAKGDLSQKIDINTTDEIGILARSFNTMVISLKAAHDKLVQSEKLASIGQLAAGVAHEINNPVGFVSSNLQTLNGYIQSLLKILQMGEDIKAAADKGDSGKAALLAKDMAAAQKEADFSFIKEDIGSLIEESKTGLERVKKIIMDLRTFAREGSGEMEYVDINKLIDGIIGIVNNEIKYKCELCKDYGDLPPVKCYSQKIGQVFINILVNASHAIKERGRITLKTYLKDQYVRVDISDTGCGIPKENLHKIFDPFFTTKPEGQGTGLGLSISYDIVKMHSGEIMVSSEVGKGSTFTVQLPVIQEDSCSTTINP